MTSKDIIPYGQTASDRLHPFVYLAEVAAAALFAAAAWSFAGDSYTDYLLVIVSAFILIAVGVPLILSRIGGRNFLGNQPDQPSFREWASGEFDTWQDHVKGANAAVEILLPLSAIAIGMIAIGIVLHLTAHSA